jgi:ribosome-associated protein
MDTTIELTTGFIPLAAALKLADVVGSGGEAKMLIRDGLVHLNGKPDTRRGAKVRAGDSILVNVDPPVRISVVSA